MRVMVVGNGAREHALAWKFSQSNRVSGLVVAPGNAGTLELGENLVDVLQDDVDAIVRVCVDRKIDLVFVGPEGPLEHGLVDALAERGIRAIGPTAQSARLEASKSFSKEFMVSYRIPTADYRSHSDAHELEAHIRGTSHALVVKKSGLAAGKGVIESDDRDLLVNAGKRFIEEGDTVVVEERLTGFEVSVFGLSDGVNHVILPPCTDYKKAGVGSKGPNTGGMGAICPVPWLTADELAAIRSSIIEPTYRGLADANLAYSGILYFGIMVTEDGPKLLEYNVRFGDPEAQVLLPLITTDFLTLSNAMIKGEIASTTPEVSPHSSVAVTIAAPGYPSEYPQDLEVRSLPRSGLLFHASTHRDGSTIRTGGGRCFTAVGVAPDLLAARNAAYATAREVAFEGSWFRPDIGGRIFG